MKAIQVKETGGPEQMQVVDIPTPQPGPKEALVKIAASGVNFIDVYFRTGLYKADLPFTLGNGSRRRGGSGGAGGDRSPAGRSRGLRDGARLLRRVCGLCPPWQLVKVPDGMWT